jgi:hypothetical protein
MIPNGASMEFKWGWDCWEKAGESARVQQRISVRDCHFSLPKNRPRAPGSNFWFGTETFWGGGEKTLAGQRQMNQCSARCVPQMGGSEKRGTSLFGTSSEMRRKWRRRERVAEWAPLPISRQTAPAQEFE